MAKPVQLPFDPADIIIVRTASRARSKIRGVNGTLTLKKKPGQ